MILASLDYADETDPLSAGYQYTSLVPISGNRILPTDKDVIATSHIPNYPQYLKPRICLAINLHWWWGQCP
jgi:hypothetical protein